MNLRRALPDVRRVIEADRLAVAAGVPVTKQMNNAGYAIIRYDHQQEQSAWVRVVYLVGYVVPVVGPFFVSTAPLARTIGVTLVGSLVAGVESASRHPGRRG
jgi:hypothetical protein